MIAPELMGHVAIPFKWKEFSFHRGCSFNARSILDAGRIAGGKESKEGRQTVFCTPSDPWRHETEEEFDGDITKPRKVHYKSKCTYSQDTVYWIHLAKAQKKELTFWQTRSHATIVHDSVLADCIGEKTLHQKTLYASACSDNNSQKCLVLTAAAATAAARHLGEHRETCTKAHQQAAGTRLQRKIHLKLISRFNEFHKLQYLKIRKECQKFWKWFTSCELDSKPNRSLEIWRRKDNPPNNSKNWEILNCMNWERFPKQFNAQRA